MRLSWFAPVALSLAAVAGLACEFTEAEAFEPAAVDRLDESAAFVSESELTTPPPDIPAAEAADVVVELDPSIDVEDNQGCVDCHPDAAATWEGSLHQRAWVEPAFQTSYAREPLEFCRGCHAPRADPALEPPAELAALGVDCVSCHVREGEIHTGPASADAKPAPHALTREPDFGETACADCHQFEFPRKTHRVRGTLMQKTMLEHERSEWAELTCADCHFPANDNGRGRNHGLAISRDPELLRASLVAEVDWAPGGEGVRFALEPNGVGHSFPTGDLFRRLELRVEVLDEAGAVIATERRYLARHFASVHEGHGLIGEARDDRLLGPATIELALPDHGGAGSSRVRWRVLYQRVDSRDHAAPERSVLAGEVELASGILN